MRLAGRPRAVVATPPWTFAGTALRCYPSLHHGPGSPPGAKGFWPRGPSCASPATAGGGCGTYLGHLHRRAGGSLELLERTVPLRWVTVGAYKNYDTHEFANACRGRGMTPHVAQRQWSRLDGRTIRHAGYNRSQKLRKRIEETFGVGQDRWEVDASSDTKT